MHVCVLGDGQCVCWGVMYMFRGIVKLFQWLREELYNPYFVMFSFLRWEPSNWIRRANDGQMRRAEAKLTTLSQRVEFFPKALDGWT